MNKKNSEELSEKRTSISLEECISDEISHEDEEMVNNSADNLNVFEILNNPMENNKAINGAGLANVGGVPRVYGNFNDGRYGTWDSNDDYVRYRQQNVEHCDSASFIGNRGNGELYGEQLNNYRAGREEAERRGACRRMYGGAGGLFFGENQFRENIGFEQNAFYEAPVRDGRNFYGDGRNFIHGNEIKTNFHEGYSGPRGYRNESSLNMRGLGEGMHNKRMLDDYTSMRADRGPENVYNGPVMPPPMKRDGGDTSTYRIIVDAVLRIQSVFEEVYTYLHGVLFHLSNDGGFGPYTEAMASQLEAFRITASRAVYTPDDRLYYKDVELKYRRGFDGRRQTSYYKNKYHAFYEENKNAEAVKHLAKIDVVKKEKEER